MSVRDNYQTIIKQLSDNFSHSRCVAIIILGRFEEEQHALQEREQAIADAQAALQVLYNVDLFLSEYCFKIVFSTVRCARCRTCMSRQSCFIMLVLLRM